MVRVKLLKSLVDFGRRRNTGILEDQIEIHPATPRIVGGLDRLRDVYSFLGVRFSARERGGIADDAACGERLTDARPIRVNQHSARVEKDRLEHVSCAFRFWPRCPST